MHSKSLPLHPVIPAGLDPIVVVRPVGNPRRQAFDLPRLRVDVEAAHGDGEVLRRKLRGPPRLVLPRPLPVGLSSGGCELRNPRRRRRNVAQ